jgi:hypothetical protein
MCLAATDVDLGPVWSGIDASATLDPTPPHFRGSGKARRVRVPSLSAASGSVSCATPAHSAEASSHRQTPLKLEEPEFDRQVGEHGPVAAFVVAELLAASTSSESRAALPAARCP